MAGQGTDMKCSRLRCYQDNSSGMNTNSLKGMHTKGRMGVKSKSETSLSESQWIEQNFQKRECVKFVSSGSQSNSCACGREKSNHRSVPEGVVRVTYPAEKWNVNRHTELSPTDAYGTIEFQGGPHPAKAQYIRLSYDTKPEKILTLLQHCWGLTAPNLLISVHGGISNFELQPKLRRVWRQGLLKAAKTTGAWIITGATNTGVNKHVGDALGDTLLQSRSNIVTLGIVPWGVVHNKEDLVGNGGNTSFHAMAAPNSNNVLLNSNHSYFLLSDDGSVGKFGCESNLRKKVEKYISQQICTRSRGKDITTPVVYLILEGDCNTIHTVLECVTENPPFPVVVIDGSGKAADLLAFAHKFANEDGTVPDALHDQLLVTIKKAFECTKETAEKAFKELMMCMKNKKHLITVFRIQEQAQDIDQAILASLLKTQNASAPDQLSRALAWDRADIAQKHIFVFGQEWPEGALDQAMMDALSNNRVDFVKLLIENGVNMSKWLTFERLEELYNTGLVSTRSQPVKGMFASTQHQSDTSSTLKHLLGEVKMHVPPDYRYTLPDIGEVINRLMSGAYRSTYSRKKFRMTYNAVTNKHCIVGKVISSLPGINPLPPINNSFRYPYSELMIWAVLLRRQRMARFMWERGEEALAKALMASKLYKSLAHEAEEDELEVDVANELRRYSEEFADLATELLEHCFKTDDDLTQFLLTYELSNWGDQTCMSLAISGRHRAFIASTGCQIVVTEMWMGGLRTRKYANLKVILGILFFPLTLFMSYRSVEELQFMPQTVEEHIQDLKGSDSDSDSSSDSDTASVSSHRSSHSEKKPKVNTQKQASRNSLNSANSESGHTSACKPSLDVFVPQNKQSSLRLGKKIYEFYTAPITKFWMHAMAYAVFLLAFIYIVLIRTPDTPTWLEWYIVTYMVGWAVEKIREFATSETTSMWQKLQVYFTDLWNIYDTFILILFFIGLTLRLVPGEVGNGRVFYCLAVALCMTHILDFFAVSQHLGPFVHIIGKMMKELLYLVVFLVIALTTFGTFRQSMWFPYEDFHWDLVKEIFLKPYYMLYGEVYADEVWPDCGPESDFKCVPGRWLVPVALSIFLIIGIVLLLSVLIAVFNNVFNRTYIYSNRVWKYQRYLLVIEYESKPILPSPLIILCHLYLLAKFLHRKWLNKKKLFDNGLKLFLDDDDVERLHDFEEECMEIYYREKENKNAVSLEMRMKMTVEKVENIKLRMDDIHQKENSIRGCLGVLEGHMVALENLTLQTTEALFDFQNTVVIKPLQLASETEGSLSVERSNLPSFIITNSEGLQMASNNQQQSKFDEKKLKHFTDYHNHQQHQAVFCTDPHYYNHHPSFVDQRHPLVQTRSTYQQNICPPKRTRHNSCVACPQTHLADDETSSHLSRKPDMHVDNVDFPLFPNGSGNNDKIMLDNPFFRPSTAMYGASLDQSRPIKGQRPTTLGPCFEGWQNNAPGKLSLRISPLSPIITPMRTEYTSITDEIDTSSVNHRSPPSTPTMMRWTNPVYKRKKENGRKRKRTLPNDHLKNAEETVHKQMEFIVHKRIRQLSLTETESTGNLAKHALESLEDHSEEEEERYIHQTHHSDDEACNGAQSSIRLQDGLKSIKSEPLLLVKKKVNETESSEQSLDTIDEDFHSQKKVGSQMEISSSETSDNPVSFSIRAEEIKSSDQTDAVTVSAGNFHPLEMHEMVSINTAGSIQSPTVIFSKHSNSSC